MQDSRRDTDVSNSLLDSVGEGDAGVYLKICYATSDFSSCKFIADLMKQREEALRQEC